ncbi:MAG: 5,10-methylenetetrahydrofolate dehydrogenase / methenyltetrahydrofolate cyclohydrolase [Alphaproteobacteria bacterium]|jgi:methylenetetrahydrofolate dehydrogenase (NADP+)/methenyltetrahydrofolate cyclohydrolase|nr:5,10-methylenetetrahydrofolate dehydrogenase / methenyltetrahydrofolate cyclohydrolase [Alphaproteobacteria bacterium]
MVATLIDGQAIATQIRQDIAHKVTSFQKQRGYAPGLAVLLIGDNPASQIYVKNKSKACEQAGIRSHVYALPATTAQGDVLEKIDALNADDRIHGILIQLPLPDSLETAAIISRIAPPKDVDGLHPQNLGLLFSGRPNLVPCTPLGCLHLIKSVMLSLEGKRAVVVGRSLLVGRPMGLLLGFEGATVVQTHSRTLNLGEECRRADILVSAVGKPGLITADHIKPGAVVIDIGTTRLTSSDGTVSLRGDVVFDEVKEVAGFLTPVPGGVGPMTIAYLLLNTLFAAEKSVAFR